MKPWAILFALFLRFSAFAAQQTPQPRFVLEDGTPIELVLAETISSADQQKGNLVIFSVAEDVKVGNVIVIPKGANAWGTITTVKSKRRVGRAGKIEVAIDKVRLADGEKVALVNSAGGNGDSHEARMATAMALSGVVAWPAAPLFLMMRGKEATLPRGTQTLAFIHGDNVLDPAKFTPEAIAWANNLDPVTPSPATALTRDATPTALPDDSAPTAPGPAAVAGAMPAPAGATPPSGPRNP